MTSDHFHFHFVECCPFWMLNWTVNPSHSYRWFSSTQSYWTTGISSTPKVEGKVVLFANFWRHVHGHCHIWSFLIPDFKLLLFLNVKLKPQLSQSFHWFSSPQHYRATGISLHSSWKEREFVWQFITAYVPSSLYLIVFNYYWLVVVLLGPNRNAYCHTLATGSFIPL